MHRRYFCLLFMFLPLLCWHSVKTNNKSMYVVGIVLHDRFIAYAMKLMYFSRWLYCIYNWYIYTFIYYSMSLFNSFALDFIYNVVYIYFRSMLPASFFFVIFFFSSCHRFYTYFTVKTSRIYIQTIPIYIFIYMQW